MPSAFSNIVSRKGPVSPVVCFRPKASDMERLAYLQQILEAQGAYRPTLADAIRLAVDVTTNLMLAELIKQQQNAQKAAA